MTIYIDAFDERSDGRTKDLAHFFVDGPCKGAQEYGVELRICFSSRHYPHIKINRGLEMILEREQGHIRNIEKYINSTLDLTDESEKQSLREYVLHRSNGVFLWVVLVIDLLLEDCPANPSKWQKLKETPRELSDLFAMTLEDERHKDKGDHRDHAESDFCCSPPA